MFTAFDLLVSSCLLYFSWYIHHASRRREKLPLPPGPRALPIIGNLLDVPKTREWATYIEWGRKYRSDILHFSIGGSSTIILNSRQAAEHLFIHNSSNYNDRPRMVLMNEMFGWDWTFSFMNASFWKDRRHAAFRYLAPAACVSYHPQQIKSTHALLRRLLSTPDDFMHHLSIMSIDVALSTFYGVSVDSKDHPALTATTTANYGLGIALARGTYVAEFWPIFKYFPAWFPGASINHLAPEIRTATDYTLNGIFDVLKKQMTDGIAPPSLLRAKLEEIQGMPDAGEKEVFFKQTFGSMYSAATETTTSFMYIFLSAMMEHPEVQWHARQELDTILGKAQLPTFDADLPYISAIVKEVLRWNPVLPLGIVHAASSDDEYNGYRIPAGAAIIPNVWAMLHDETVYPEPEMFKPERFLKNGRLNPDAKDPFQAFGFTRRACVGKHFALQTIWMEVASILAMFEISSPDAAMADVDPNHSGTGGINHLLPFKCLFKPRSVECEELIKSTGLNATI